MGAHPKAPSRLVTATGPVSLSQYIAEAPAEVLGRDIAEHFGGTLPFLFKVLSAAEPLSIQAHPTRAQAQAGFAREEQAGIPLDARERNYRDDNHKPELICALTPFWGLRGFRSPAEIRAEFSAGGYDLPEALRLPDEDSHLADFFASLMTLGDDDRTGLLDSAITVAREKWPDPGSWPALGDPLARYFWLLRLDSIYPGDVGVLGPLFLRLFSLHPGEATYQPAGVLHGYLHGTGAELMANSDNVLRGGLTPKHIDLRELLAVGVFRTEAARIITGTPGSGSSANCTITDYPTPFEEFLFSRIEVQADAFLPPAGPEVLLCTEGQLTLGLGGTSVPLVPGASAFVTADDPGVSVEGRGVLLRATVGWREAT